MRGISPIPEGGFALTVRETEILDLLASRGYVNREIALTLGIGERTVKAHLARMMRKAKVGNRTALVHLWLKHVRSELTT